MSAESEYSQPPVPFQTLQDLPKLRGNQHLESKMFKTSGQKVNGKFDFSVQPLFESLARLNKLNPYEQGAL